MYLNQNSRSKQHSAGILVVLLAVVGLAGFSVPGYADEFAVDANTLFLSHFNSTTDADFAKGSPKHLQGAYGLTQGGGGVFGEALICKTGMITTPMGDAAKAMQMSFALDDNLNLQKGTLEFWVKCTFSKKAADSTQPALYYLFDIPSKDKYENGLQKRMTLVIREASDGTRYFHCFFGEAGAGNECCTKIEWTPDQWHHVAVTWDMTEGTLFLDGTKIQTNPLQKGILGSDRDNCDGVFWVGGLSSSSDKHDGCMDELRISSSVRYRENFKPETPRKP